MATGERTRRKSRNVDNKPKTVAKSKKARLSVTIPKWVKESMGRWVNSEQFPSESELTGIGMACFIFMLENSERTSTNNNDIQVIKQEIEEIQKTLELILKTQKLVGEQE